MIGERYGRLVVVRECGRDKFSQKLWLCKCDCGGEIITNTNRLHVGKTKSCGCLKAEGNNKKHGMCYSRINGIYRKMKQRCYSKKNPRYMDYGGRGITICNEWLGERGFENFVVWSYKNGYSDEKSIDRIDNDKGYFPDNCRWATTKAQNNNQRRNLVYTVNGEKHTLAELSEIYGVEYQKLLLRVRRLNWNIERALEVE